MPHTQYPIPNKKSSVGVQSFAPLLVYFKNMSYFLNWIWALIGRIGVNWQKLPISPVRISAFIAIAVSRLA
ncbi:hypothetical protein H6G41_22360 [Tolypothrix sp. FACHB-123]|uniref:hypothetical protein n=1 Tax=Tolypothrix sp. FACHB-123 TaxID=2692868 RepID=UPI0016883981|nr:hypothetical protein [Tolypothrix sp. FACHB-123]MBD2357329.1 hypothetical protein [Tolypothrix sp. FACHB-123]